MKKILSIVLTVFLLIGCGQANNDGAKNKAIEAYVKHANKLVGEKTLDVKVKGQLEIPKSVVNTEEVKADIDMSGTFNMDASLFMMDFKMNDLSNSSEQMSFKIYSDTKYMYMSDGKRWLKQPLDSETQASFKEFKKEKIEKVTVEDASEMFGVLKDTKYTEETVNGVEGYTIEGKVNLDQIMSAMKDSEEEKEAKKQIEQVKSVFNELDINLKTFVPKDTKEQMKNSITVNMDVLNTKINVGPFDIEILPSKEKIVIPQKAKDAKIEQVNKF